LLIGRQKKQLINNEVKQHPHHQESEITTLRAHEAIMVLGGLVIAKVIDLNIKNKLSEKKLYVFRFFTPCILVIIYRKHIFANRRIPDRYGILVSLC